MNTNYEVIKGFNCRRLAEFITEFDMFCSMCAYDLGDCKSKCVDGHEAWLKQNPTEKQKEKLPRMRG
ncbi:MAG: hypothetical protein ACI3VR_11850 [Intestinibacter sp.]|uniref:hypothetical protein n=1 Tax=Intestinibacter sp. TaxID=1965304 RepID=UPI003F164800